MQTLCRVCLDQHIQIGEQSVDLFQTVVRGETIGTFLNDLFGIGISADDNLPQSICQQCFQELRSIFVFKEKLFKSDETLRAKFTVETSVKAEEHLLEETVVSCSATTTTSELADHEYTTIEIISSCCCVCGNAIFDSEQTFLLHQEESDGYLIGSENAPNRRICHACYGPVNREKGNGTAECRTVQPDEVTNLPATDAEKQQENQLKSLGDKANGESKAPRLCCVTHCKEMFYHEGKLLQHAQEAHAIKIRWNRERQELGKLYKCNICCRAFNSSKNLRIHKFVRTNHHGKQYLCQECPFRATSNALLIIHNRSHTGERPFGCNQCEKRFYSELNLKNHQICHQPERPFVCSYCAKQFARKRNMEEHVRSCHSDEKPYSCDVCSARFKVQQHLRLHRRLHTGEKPYTCSYCPNSFYHISDRKRHEMSHTGEKPYSCKTCGLSYTRKRTLTIHERTHTGERPFSCNDCGRTFNQAALLKRHMARHQHAFCSGSVRNDSPHAEAEAKNDRHRSEQEVSKEKAFIIEEVLRTDQTLV